MPFQGSSSLALSLLSNFDSSITLISKFKGKGNRFSDNMRLFNSTSIDRQYSSAWKQVSLAGPGCLHLSSQLLRLRQEVQSQPGKQSKTQLKISKQINKSVDR